MKSKLRGMFVLSPPEILSTKTSPHKNIQSNLVRNLFITKQIGDMMKTKIILITIFSLFCFLSAVFAQDVVISSGPIPKLKNERTNITYQSNAYLLTAGYAYSATNQSILSASGPCAFNFLAFWSTSGYLSSMCQGGDGKYYVTGTNGPSLYQLDTVNVSFVLLGNITGMGSDVPNGISYNPVNGNYYIASSSNLFSFNVNTRAATLIGPFNTGGIMIDLCFDMNGICYAYDIGTDNGYTINISTGNANLLGPLGYDANFGQGMSYDYQTNTIFLSAFNNNTFTGQCRTMNPVTGMTTLISDWGLEQIDAFALAISQGPPCPVGTPSNPNPPNGATGLPLTGNTVSWTNGAGTTQVEVWFGPTGNIVKVYDGPAVTQYVLPTLNYSTVYQWYVVCKDEICGTQGPIWTFTTIQDPNLFGFCDEFNNLNNWTIVGPLGLTNWSAASSSSAGGTPPELRMSWTPSFNGESKIRSDVINLPNNQCCELNFNFYFDWFADPSGIVTVGITYDGGVTSTILYSATNPTGNVGPSLITSYFISPSSGAQNLQIEITYSGYSFNTDNVYWDNMCIGILLSSCEPPSAPSNLNAQVIFNPNPQVQLGWQDNSWNEYGFKIFRKFGYPNDPGDYIVIDTTLNNVTQFIDVTVLPESTYTYRVFAFGQWGQNGSNTATIAVPVPVELISFTAEVDGNVVTLFWQTATETNNSGFEIERQVGNKQSAACNWDKVGFVEGKGTTTEIQSYSFTDKPEPGTYKYRLKQIDFDGTFAYSPEVEAEVKAPNVFSLEQNYPNPFNPSTKIKYTIPASSLNPFSKGEGTFVTLKVYDILGNEVATLVNEEQAPGVYEVEFNVAQVSRPEITSGVYFYQLLVSALQSNDGKAGEFIQTKKMVILK